MIQYFKDLYNNFIKATLFKKIVAIILIILYVLILLSVTIKVNVEVVTPGTINNTVKTKGDDKTYAPIEIDTDNKSGLIYTIGIYSHIRVSYFQYLLSKFSDDMDIVDYDPATDLTEAEEYERGLIHKDYSIVNALIVAYEKAKEIDPTINIEYDFEGLVVSAKYSYSKSDFEVGDIIIKVEDTAITNHAQFKELVANYKLGDYFKVTVKRGDETKVVNVTKVSHTNALGQTSNVIGIEAVDLYNIDEDKTTPKFTISEEFRSIGPSGGAMMALAVYNSLIGEDITKGKYILGTGTIDVNGNVGQIGGVQQKIITANMYNTDYFFVPYDPEYNPNEDLPDNYTLALEKYNEINPKFKLIKVATFDDIINALKGENNE